MPLSQHELLNLEGIIALGFVIALLVRNGKQETNIRSVRVWPFAVIVVLVALLFAPILGNGFLYDDYTHITEASHSGWRTVAEQFGPVSGPGLFFRPLGFFFYSLNYWWAGGDPAWWHASSIAMHVICSCLVYALGREIGASWLGSSAGALLFGLTGLSAETVAWIDARFDLMATLLVLLSLICICRGWPISALALGAAGMLCKESAYCLPLLITILAFFKDDRRRILRAAAFAGILAAVLFGYRWWALGGIGGYGLHFNVLRSAEALLFRQWALLCFPFNWSAPASPGLLVVVFAVPFVLATAAWMAKAPRRRLIGCVAFVLAAGLPVQHLLLLDSGLGGSRVLYLGSVGWALLWAVLLDSMAWRRAVVAACLMLAIEASMLEHNLRVWRDTSELARSVCESFGRMSAYVQGPIVVRNLPASRIGVVFLANGFPECVEMNSGVPAWRIEIGGPGTSESGAHEFVWSEAAGRMVETTRH